MRIIIIGGGACGASAAARIRRLDANAEITILEATDEISVANCGLPYFCSGVISDRGKMTLSSPQRFKSLFNIDVRLNSKVIGIDRLAKNVGLADGTLLPYDKLVLATGASPIVPPIDGIDGVGIFTVRTLSDADAIKKYASENKCMKAVVIGGGFIGVEMAENFVHMGMDTSVIELAPQILAPLDAEIAAFAQNEMRAHGVKLILGDGVGKFGKNCVVLSSGKIAEFDIAVLAIGVRPETDLAKSAGLELGARGGIAVDEFMRTSDANIYAGGDGVEVVDLSSGSKTLIPLAGPANKQGRIIADNICGKNVKYSGTFGAAVVKVFNLTVASVGNNEKVLKRLGVAYQKNIITINSSAGYYPGAAKMTLKLLFSAEGKIFGAQAVGLNGVDKRIDDIAALMHSGGTVADLAYLELCYAPPYSSAKDPVNILGMNASNILDGLVKPAFPSDLDGAFIIDVRPSAAFAADHIDGSVNIPAAELPARLHDIPKEGKVVLYCFTGYTSYVAARMLMQRGFDNVYSFCGGMEFYKEFALDKLLGGL